MSGLQDQRNDAGLAARPLTDKELDGVAGANFPGLYKEERTDFYLWANWTTQVGCGDKYFKKAIFYFPCPRCGRPMHSKWYESKWYCDPCDFSCLRPDQVKWNGTKEELIAAAGF